MFCMLSQNAPIYTLLRLLPLLAMTAQPLLAQDGSRTWTGAVDSDFYNVGNWTESGGTSNFPNGIATFSGNSNTSITRTSNTYNYLYGLLFTNSQSSDNAFTIGATPGSGTQINWGGPTITTTALTGAGSLTDTINSNIALIGSVVHGQTAKVFNLGANHNLHIAGVISGGNTADYSFTKQGTGTLTLSGINTYDIVTTVSAGTLEITHKDALGSTTAGTVVQDGATVRLSFASNGDATGDAFTVSGAGYGGAGALDVVDSDINGAITLDGDATIKVTTRFDHSNTISGTGTLTKTGTGAMVRGQAITADNLVIAEGEYLSTGTNALVTGDGTANTGTVTVQGGASLTLWKTGINNTPDIVLEGNSNYQVSSNTADQVTSIDGTMLLNGNVDFKNWNTKHTVNSDISGTGGISLIQINSNSDYAEYTLTGTNTYAGQTTVGNGQESGRITLRIDGDNSGATGDVIVENHSTLTGSGTIGGGTTVRNGASLNPGNSPGILTFNDTLTLEAGSTTTMEIDGTTRGTEYDGIDVAGLLTFGGDLVITSDSTILEGTYNLFDIQGSSAGDFNSITLAGVAYNDDSLTKAGEEWSTEIGGIRYTFSEATGAFVVVPEPGAFALLTGLISLGWIVLRRRKA